MGGTGSPFGLCLGVFTDRTDIRSQLGHQLAIQSGEEGLRCNSEPYINTHHSRKIGCVVLCESPGTYKVSLRSVEDDTAQISEAYGGGGHTCASSFRIKSKVFNRLWKW